MIPLDLIGKIAIVTGGSSDLGKVMAARLAEAGADIALHYHSNKARAEKVGAEITKLGRRVCLVQGDVTVEAEVKAIKQTVEKELGAPDIVVTNANTGGSQWKLVLEQSIEGYENQFRGCVVQNVLMAQAFVPGMIAKKWGRIVAISTECVMQNQPTQSNYVVGKKGMDGMLRILAKEIGMHGITVNQVAPGWTISERDRVAGTEHDEGYERNVPLKRRGTDLEIANVVTFLASDLASFITGLYLPVCGGNVMPCV
jgi:3-oxoacyl-[acyl-carrier protein] reductase